MDKIWSNVAEQRHKDPQFDKGLPRTVGLGKTGRVGGTDKAQGIVDY